MSCLRPINAATLADYWLGLSSEQDELSIEEHLLGCDGCSARLRETIALADGVRQLASEGSLDMIVSDAFQRRAAEQGLQVRQYASSPGESIACTVSAQDDLLLSRLAADLVGARRVDLSICDEHGVEKAIMRDIPVREGAGGVVVQHSITFARALPTTRFITRLVGVDASGNTRLLGEYTFNHTRTLP